MKHLYFLILALLASCGLTHNKTDRDDVVDYNAASKVELNTPASNVKLTNKKVKFLWRANKYDEVLKDTISAMSINEDFCKTITDPERAALGYVATFIGNECDWDGDYRDDRSNMKCKILTALDLGYQCSDKHLGFLRQMFKKDNRVLKELESDNCPTTPEGSTIQETFDEISLIVEENKISVFFKASGFNTRDSYSWSWTETDYFQVDNGSIKMIKKNKSKVKRVRFDLED